MGFLLRSLLAAVTAMPLALATTAPAEDAGAPGPAALPSDPELDRTYPIRLEAASRAVRLSVINAARTLEYGPARAAPGRSILVLHTEWENNIPLTLALKQKLATAYKVPRLADHIYLVADGRLLLRLHPRAGELPGHVPPMDLTLEKLGDRLRGNVAFDAPAGPIGSLELRYYDFAHGHLTIPLGAPVRAGPPLAPPGKNEVVSAAVYGVESAPELGGRKAPAGLKHLTVDLRATSLLSIDGDASAFDPKARPGQVMKIGTVADWKESRRYLQVVADGEYACTPLPESDLPEEPRFLPDIPTGGLVAFLVPEAATSLELRCDFPNAAVPGAPKTLRPAGIAILLEGKRPALPERPAIASVADDVYRLAVTGQDVRDEFAGAAAGAGKRFLVLDVTVRNAGTKGEFFQTKEQLSAVGADGSTSPLDPATFGGPRRPPELIWIPAGEQRSFQAAFRIGAEEARPRLAYRGVSLAKTLDLKPLVTGTAAAGAPEIVGAAPRAGETGLPAAPPMEEVPSSEAPPRATALPAPPDAGTRVAAPTERLPDRVTARQDREPRGLAAAGLAPEDVNAAIDRGTAWLWEWIRTKELAQGKELGRFGDAQEDVIYSLALVHAGAHRKLPEFDAALRGFLTRFGVRDIPGGYGSGLFCMLVEAYGDPAFVPKLRLAARYLIEAQGREGTWSYRVNVPPEAYVDPETDRILRVEGGAPIDGSRREPWRRMTDISRGIDGDNSVSQFALLGLHAASRAGVPIPRDVWTRNLAAQRARQCKDGGWGYTEGNSYGSMTCAGICAVAVDRHELGESDPASDEAIEKGLGWLSGRFTVGANPRKELHHYYYLYSLERVGRILETEFIGQHEWYPAGARYLVDAQQPDGRWTSKGDGTEPLATSFALLFLTRATPTLDVARARGGSGTLKTAIALPPAARVHFILDASGSMTAAVDGREKFDIARDAVSAIVGELGEGSEVGLRAYGHSKRAIEKDADRDTQLIVPLRRLDRGAFESTLKSLRARGKTPLALSMEEAAADLRGAKADRPVTLILLTDGGEDTLERRDPLKAAEALGKIPGIRFYVVGFDVGNRADWERQLRGIAERAAGTYVPAARADSLARALRSAVFGLPDDFTVLDAEGKPAATGRFGDARTLPEGKYLLRTSHGGLALEEPFWINTGAITLLTFDAGKARGGGTVAGKPAAPAAAAPAAPGAPPAAAPAPTAPATPAAPEKKYCTGCGKSLAPGAKFCSGCGARVGG